MCILFDERFAIKGAFLGIWKASHKAWHKCNIFKILFIYIFKGTCPTSSFLRTHNINTAAQELNNDLCKINNWAS